MKIKWGKLLTKGKAIYLAYDQGLEHGPVDFNDSNVDPLYILEIAEKGKFNGVVFQKGIAEKYNNEIKKSGVGLIMKLNGKTNLPKGEPISRQLCSVREAVDLGAVAVGYTIYIGSTYESIMLEEFENIEKEAHALGLPVIAWVYPRGKGIAGKTSRGLMAYSARVALEIGADMVKLQYNGVVRDLQWAVKSAGKTKVVIAGGVKKEGKAFLREVENVMKAGAVGLAVGRNVWQNKEPLEISGEIRGIVLG
ncbi:MAG: hypothetical protein ABIG28_01900 [archaeon]